MQYIFIPNYYMKNESILRKTIYCTKCKLHVCYTSLRIYYCVKYHKTEMHV